MTAITITPRNKKELTALKHFIKALDLNYNENKSSENERELIKNTNENSKLTKKEFDKKLENSYSINEFSQKSTSFLENLSWNK